MYLPVRIKTLNGQWVVTSAPASGPVTISGLQHDSTYLYQISTCSDTTNNWTTASIFNFDPITPPNVVLIILDDSRSDFFSCNGAPPYLQTPSIDRVANEGVNFRSYLSTCSICAPSRACMASGLYPIKNGAINNDSHIDPAIPTVDRILHDNGYYTAMLGKNHGTFLYGNGTYDFWMDSQNDDDSPLKQFQYNGKPFHCRVILLKFDIILLSPLLTVYIQPLFLWLYRIPHKSIIPEPQYDEYLTIIPCLSRAIPLNTPSTIPFIDNLPQADSSVARSVIGIDWLMKPLHLWTVLCQVVRRFGKYGQT
jgi:hypothetical protein